MKEGEKLPQSHRDLNVVAVVSKAWDLDLMRKVMAEMNLDTERLPLGRLQRD